MTHTPPARPDTPKLTAAQRYMLDLAVKHDGFIHHRDAMYVSFGRGNAAVMKGLVKRQWMEDEHNGWRLTAAGRAALGLDTATEPLPFDGTPQPAPQPSDDAATFDALMSDLDASEHGYEIRMAMTKLATFCTQHRTAIRAALASKPLAVVLDAQQRKVLETLTADNTRLIDTGQPHQVSIVVDVFEVGFVPTAMYFDLKDKGWIYHVPGKGYLISDAGREALRRIDSGSGQR